MNILGITKSNWNQRVKYFKKNPADFMIDKLMITLIGFPFCAVTINALINAGWNRNIFIVVVILYVFTSLFWGWRVLRALRKRRERKE